MRLRLLATVTAVVVSTVAALGQTGQPASPLPGPKLPPSAGQSSASPQKSPELWGAVAFTADGSYSTVWKSPSKPEAEAHVLKGCAKFGRGACEVIAFPGRLCGALAHYKGAHSGKNFRISHTGGGATSPEAQKNALESCRTAKNVRGSCQLRTVVCGDGR